MICIATVKPVVQAELTIHNLPWVAVGDLLGPGKINKHNSEKKVRIKEGSMEDIERQTKNAGHDPSSNRELLKVLKQKNHITKQGFRKINQTVYMKDWYVLRKNHQGAIVIILMRGDNDLNKNIISLILMQCITTVKIYKKVWMGEISVAYI